MGDAAGIGAEIILKSLRDKTLTEVCHPILIGDFNFVKNTAKQLGMSFDFVNFNDVKSKSFVENAVVVYDLDNLSEECPIGIESAIAGKASAQYIESAVDLWKRGEIDAITTAPINKKSINLGGYDFPGHTEFLASLTAVSYTHLTLPTTPYV